MYLKWWVSMKMYRETIFKIKTSKDNIRLLKVKYVELYEIGIQIIKRKCRITCIIILKHDLYSDIIEVFIS